MFTVKSVESETTFWATEHLQKAEWWDAAVMLYLALCAKAISFNFFALF